MGGNKRRKTGKDSPPDHAKGKHAARTETIGESARQRLKNRVAHEHRAEYFSQLYVAEMVGIGDRASGNGDVHAVEIRNCTENEEPEHEIPAHAGCCGVRHLVRLLMR